MSDLSISQKFNMPITTPQFRSSNTNPISSTNKENKGLSTGVKVAIGTGLVALASYGIYMATRGKVKPESMISEKVLSNGKKIIKKVEKTKDGAEKVIMNVYDDKGALQLTREKVITRMTNPKNGRKYITIDKKYTSPLEDTCYAGIYYFVKNGKTCTKKYYSSEGKKFFETKEYTMDLFKGSEKGKVREFIRPDGSKKCSFTHFSHENKPNIRSSRSYIGEKNSNVYFNINGTVGKPKNF